ncbi:hypothetical protein B9J77_05015 [candidate division NPL-UPA2 bacterium Unc8]|uniref:Glycogen debranching protein n=1 Tax=candidate division NPL-UPA2 bacterium Unc8 TaxID=1980939 RepID=A0A399FTN4_UNCN2|nr:hypothetical protein [Bacillota bacterium]RIH99617.1 MAG: hypothetical protein B9J77_05015 [candidate division NPL-UPA2 bacterium Unc8]
MNIYEFTPYEWILSNSAGSYALGPANLINHRKYHGLLIASTPDLRRMHLVSSIEERIEAEGRASFFLDSSNYSNVVYPQGYKHMVKYFLRPFPAFLYSTIRPSDEVLILKFIQMHPLSNATVIRYRNLGKVPLRLILRPKFTLRGHHTVNQPGYRDSAAYRSELKDRTAKIANEEGEAFAFSSTGSMESDPIIYRQVLYPSEIIRGYEGAEDIFSPFRVTVELYPGEEQGLVFADKEEKNFERMIEETEKRYQTYPLPLNHPLLFKNHPRKILMNLPPKGNKLTQAEACGYQKGNSYRLNIFEYKEYLRVLEQAMREFLAGDDLIAGFPWFSAWGRDAMISLEALKHFEGGTDLAYRILKKYGENMENGIIPNTLGEEGVGQNYDTVDASLWFGLRVLESREKFTSSARAELLRDVVEVIGNYLLNPSLPFHVDFEDGLISIYPHTGLGLTWMDAKVDGQPVTPRYGKPVEINALWYNLLKLFLPVAMKEGIEEIPCGDRNISLSGLKSLAGKAGKSLKLFFTGEGFADRIENGRLIMELRPNYIIALSLPVSIFSKEEMSIGYRIAGEKLLTPYGLRSLSPGQPAFRSKYMGNQRMRDLAYHQGTVWVWLLLPLAKVAAKIYRKDKNKLKGELNKLICSFRDGFMKGKIASLPELYDGRDPHFPKGASAQCWSVAAVFLIEKNIEELGQIFSKDVV